MSIAKPALSTKKFAALNNVTPCTIRRHHSDFGHFHNVKPLKLENGDLQWPAVVAVRVRRKRGAA